IFVKHITVNSLTIYLILHNYLIINDIQQPYIYTLSLHDALPISIKIRNAIIPVTNIGSRLAIPLILIGLLFAGEGGGLGNLAYLDRKSTRLNSSHVSISYAVFCLKKKK